MQLSRPLYPTGAGRCQTKRTAEELTDYLRDVGINVRYLHSEIDAIERVEILSALRKGEFDVLVGINLLREAGADFDVTETLRELEEEMLTAANNLEFEKAALLRDQIKELKRQFGLGSAPAKASGTNAAATVSYRKGKKRR